MWEMTETLAHEVSTLKAELHVVHKVSKQLDLESPAEKILTLVRGIRETALASALPQVAGQCSFIIATITENKNLFAADIDEQLAKGSVDIDGETASYLLQEVTSGKHLLRGIPSMLSNLSVVVADTLVANAPEDDRRMDEWDFDVLSLAGNVGRPLTSVFYHVFEKRKLAGCVGSYTHTLVEYISAIEDLYQCNPFHNAMHAADVVHSLDMLLSMAQYKCLSADNVLALLVAGAVHDVGHIGRNNNFLMHTDSELAMVYNDKSILENYHLSTAFKLLSKHNFLQGRGEKVKREFRSTVIDIVLATDMARHFEFVSLINAKAESFKPKESAADTLLLMQLTIKVADIGNVTKPEAQYRQWSEFLLQEFFAQGDDEKALGLPQQL
eukprot:m51a1_g7354 putative phosphodiesterase 4d (384) ;mRNA; r:27370-29301